MTLYNKAIATIFATATLLSSPVFAAENQFLGTWKTEKKGDESKTADVEIKPCDNNPEQLCGKIVDIEQRLDPVTFQPKLDKNNKDKSLRNRPVIGLSMLEGLSKKGDHYTGGTIYSPKTGKTYDATLKIKDQNTLEVTGHVFVFSSTQTWKRVK